MPIVTRSSAKKALATRSRINGNASDQRKMQYTTVKSRISSRRTAEEEEAIEARKAAATQQRRSKRPRAQQQQENEAPEQQEQQQQQAEMMDIVNSSAESSPVQQEQLGNKRLAPKNITNSDPSSKRIKNSDSSASKKNGVGMSQAAKTKLLNTLKEKSLAVQTLQDQVSVLEAQLQAKISEFSALQSSMAVSQTNNDEFEEKLKEFNQQMAFYEEQITTLEEQLANEQTQREAVQDKLVLAEVALEAKTNELYHAAMERGNGELKINQLTEQMTSQYRQLQTYGEEMSKYEQLLEQQRARIAMLEEQERLDFIKRKKLFNTIQELKGNIRVYCRVRPSLKPVQDEDEEVETTIKYTPDTDLRGVEILNTRQTKALDSGLNRDTSYFHKFEFDRVFRPTASQADVFEEISQLVQSAMNGYKVCVFAYGATGSGKTHTMQGDIQDAELAGMIPRSIQHIFAQREELKKQAWQYDVTASFMEIYNEKLRDLLDDNVNAKPLQIQVKQTKKKNAASATKAATAVAHVPGLIVQEVNCVEDMEPLMAMAARNRSVSATNCNEHSSRSHSVFQLTINGYNSVSGETTTGILNLVDLAGSERIKVSGATGQRLTESKAINKSLSCLGDVISALAKRAKHIPFRNSTLTFLLQNCFTRSSKTLMFVNLSPDEEHAPESLCSLRFAQKVNACEIGTATRNVTSSSSSSSSSSSKR